jgi:Putative sensor
MNATMSADEIQGAQIARRSDPLAQFFLAPFHARSYTSLIYLLLSLPLGVVYFTFLATGLSAGAGLLITLLGLPIVGLTLLGSWWLAALERQMAIGLLGAEVPPMGPKPFQSGQGIRRDLEDFLSNRVTWTGMLFLGLKLPLGVVSFVMAVTLIALSFSLLLVPFLYPFRFMEWDSGILWWVDSPAEAALCFAIGLVCTYVSLLLLNGLAVLWKKLATGMLGSGRFLSPPPAEAEAGPAVA